MTPTRIAGWLRRVTRAAIESPSAQQPAQGPHAPEAGPPEKWHDQLALAGVVEAAWLADRRASGRLYADLPDGRVTDLKNRFPAQAAQTCAAADRIRRHEFNLLGSGWRHLIDPDRPVRADGYHPIDWAVDPIAGLRFPSGFPHSDWNPQMRPGLADIKWPWEIGRCQHWIPLAQAFRLTGDERYAAEIVREFDDFMEVNPVGVGVQYVCTMDVAIRALNWALAFELIRGSESFDGPASVRAYRSLFDVGVFIERNLENKYEVTSNHFLSNVVGLYGLGVMFRDLPAGRRWLTEGRAWLEQEMIVQVLSDGADYESSVPYHRLVLELFLAGERLAECEGSPLSAAYRESLRRMTRFMAAVLRPDGRMPQVGDADDGRLHIFSAYGEWQPQDARHILAPTAMMLGERSWLDSAGAAGPWEAAWWGCDVGEEAILAVEAADAIRLFPFAGLAVAKTSNAYLLVTNGRVGTNGFGNHKHNDLLSFEYHADGVPLIVDPGSFVYTSDPDARDLFRGTGYHNTIQIDGVEQNDIRPGYLFRLFETSTVDHLGFDDGADRVEYHGRHTGYERLAAAVTHERIFHLDKPSGALAITDRLRGGAGTHTLVWHFHLAPGVAVDSTTDREWILAAEGRRWSFSASTVMTATVSDAWYSPSYGVRVPCRAIRLETAADVSPDRTYEFHIRSAAPDHG